MTMGVEEVAARLAAGETVVTARRRGQRYSEAQRWAKQHGLLVFIGRPSKWGNPYRIGVDGDRGECIERYRRYLLGRPDLMASVGALRGRLLVCACAPERCHGDVLAEVAREVGASNHPNALLQIPCNPAGNV